MEGIQRSIERRNQSESEASVISSGSCFEIVHPQCHRFSVVVGILSNRKKIVYRKTSYLSLSLLFKTY